MESFREMINSTKEEKGKRNRPRGIYKEPKPGINLASENSVSLVSRKSCSSNSPNGEFDWSVRLAVGRVGLGLSNFSDVGSDDVGLVVPMLRTCFSGTFRVGYPYGELDSRQLAVMASWLAGYRSNSAYSELACRLTG
ncbi:hypothetical protein F2Q69_00028480 [Brassica cretica]|uniref:Uncharacterized protein n=1 Tax=Brassica cretica TaxID=69181 RepID=A0A8S9S8N3_BRACR|nr:hypothetical protein F2Q69_00028480 [Brassica cretica]